MKRLFLATALLILVSCAKIESNDKKSYSEKIQYGDITIKTIEHDGCCTE